MSHFSEDILTLYNQRNSKSEIIPAILVQNANTFYAADVFSTRITESNEKYVLTLFYPELLSPRALQDLKAVMNAAVSDKNIERIDVLCFLGCFWMLMELKSH